MPLRKGLEVLQAAGGLVSITAHRTLSRCGSIPVLP
jgi:hypothetical protein